MRYVITMLAAATLVTLAGCERPTVTNTVVKEPVIQKEKETVIEKEPGTTTIVQTPATSDPNKPETVERSKSTTTTRVDTPYGSATRTETESTKTTK